MSVLICSLFSLFFVFVSRVFVHFLFLVLLFLQQCYLCSNLLIKMCCFSEKFSNSSMDLFKRFLRQFDMTEQLPHARKAYVTVLTTQKEIDDVIWVFTRSLTTKHRLNKHTQLILFFPH